MVVFHVCFTCMVYRSNLAVLYDINALYLNTRATYKGDFGVIAYVFMVKEYNSAARTALHCMEVTFIAIYGCMGP